MTFVSQPVRPVPAKLLVANRGEIAVRIIRACHDIGIATVAVYSSVDRDAMHADLADEAFALNETGNGYLDIEELIAVARRSGAKAVHPGYGFLAENADFARRVTDAGLTWIGPPPDAISVLGDKIAARALAVQVEAPLVAGTPGAVSGVEDVLAFTDEHGFPIAIKAAYGGGGRGIKVVTDRESVAAAYDSAVRESVKSFGRDECFVECFLATPRHVETQCLADEHGNIRVISTRDCSLQRRNQKLLEEAPAPTLTASQADLLERSSIAILRAAHYVGAGTCEFLIDGDRVTFLEVNTRIQVEHPISEEVSGIDLIAGMILIAFGSSLGPAPTVRGHSIEFRINAEDVAAGFAPAPGTISRLAWPTGPGIRVDTGYRSGDTIPAVYDSLIAKLIVTAPDRRLALQRARRALSETVIEGMPTSLDFHRQIVGTDAFTDDNGRAIFTGWIDKNYNHEGSSAPTRPSAAPQGTERIVAEVDGRRLVILLPEPDQSTSEGNTHDRAGAKVADSRLRSGESGANAVCSTMAGSIVKVLAYDGKPVKKGDAIVIVEAMKMERPIFAHRAGTVRDLSAEAGDKVTAGAQVCRIITDRETSA